MRGHRGFLLEVQSHAGMFSACVGGSKRGERAEGKKHEKGERKESPYSPPFFPFSPYPSRRLLRRLGCFLRRQLIRLNAI